MCCRGRQLGLRNSRLPLPRFRGGDHQLYAAAVQLERHDDPCAHAFQSSFAFSELIPLIHMKVKKEGDLLVAWECFWKRKGAVSAEVSLVAGFSRK